ncbi:MAG: hypothetical protein ACRDJV_07450 [Actinomycetota bacterium]
MATRKTVRLRTQRTRRRRDDPGDGAHEISAVTSERISDRIECLVAEIDAVLAAHLQSG